MAKGARAQKEEAVAPLKQKRGHPIFKVVGAAVIIIALVLVYLYIQFGNLALSLASTFSSGQQPNSTTLQGVMMQKVNSMPNVTANYTGTINITQDPPFVFSFSKYHRNSRIYLSIKGLPTFGNMSVLYVGTGNISLNSLNGTACFKQSGGTFANSVIMNQIRTTGKQTDGYYCVNTDGNSTLINSFMNTFVNFSTLSNVATNNYGINVGNGCALVTGTGIVNVNSSIVGVSGGNPQTPADLNFTTCISGQYNIPIYFVAHLHVNHTLISITLNQSAFSQSASQSQVTALP